MYKLDNIDNKLIELLKEDARQPSQKLAKRLNTSPATIRRRVRNLIRNRVIRISAIVNPAQLGKSLIAVIALDLVPEKMESVLGKLKKQPQIIWLASTTGRFDAVAIAWFNSTDDFSSFIEKELVNLDGLRNSETSICLRVPKTSRDF